MSDFVTQERLRHLLHDIQFGMRFLRPRRSDVEMAAKHLRKVGCGTEADRLESECSAVFQGNKPTAELISFVQSLQSTFRRATDAEKIRFANADETEVNAEQREEDPDPKKTNGARQMPSGDEIKKPINRPPEMALKAWRLRDLKGDTQEQIAKELGTNQGQVSRWISLVSEYLKAGNVLPELKEADRPVSVNPNVLEMGKRRDGLTPRQRSKTRDDDSIA